MDNLQLEIQFVTHNRFSQYEWPMTILESDRYNRFQRGGYCVVPNDDPCTIATIVADSNQTMELDILPAIRGIKRFFKYAKVTPDCGINKTVNVRFVGFNPTPAIKQAAIMMMQTMIGLGFTYQLA